MESILNIESINNQLGTVKSLLLQMQECIINLEKLGLKIEVKIDSSTFKVQ